MKIPDDQARKIVWEALFRHDGDRAKAAEELGVSIRTLYRRLDRLGLYDMVDKMGWTDHKGPPRKLPRGASVALIEVLAAIREGKGRISVGQLATKLYGSDTPDLRDRTRGILADLVQRRAIRQDRDNVWYIEEIVK